MNSSRLPLGVEFNILDLSVTPGKRLATSLPAKLSDISAVPPEGMPERKIELSTG